VQLKHIQSTTFQAKVTPGIGKGNIMKIDTYVKIAWKVGFMRLLKNAGLVYSTIFILINAYAITFPDQFPDWGWLGFWIPIFLSFLLSIILWFPKLEYSGKLVAPDTTIKIKVGNLFEQQEHLVIGTNDVFDTQTGEIIKAESIQGQFLTKIYGGDTSKLDQEILAELTPHQHKEVIDSSKTHGKNSRYPIGTTITLGNINRRYYLTAYSSMGADLVCTGNTDSIIKSLDCLWDEIRRRGQGYPISMPIVGSDLARTNLSRMTLIKIIAGSFILASKQRFITRQLTILIHPRDIDDVNLYEIGDFLKSVSF